MKGSRKMEIVIAIISALISATLTFIILTIINCNSKAEELNKLRVEHEEEIKSFKDAYYTNTCDLLNIEIRDIKITLKGLEYLNENTMMKRAARTFAGVKEIKGVID